MAACENELGAAYESNVLNLRGEIVGPGEPESSPEEDGPGICRFQAWMLFYVDRTGNDIYTRDELLESFYVAMGCSVAENRYLEMSDEQASIFVAEGEYFIRTSNGEHFIPISTSEDLRDALMHAVGGTRVDELFEKFCLKNGIVINDGLDNVLDLDRIYPEQARQGK